MVASPFKSAYVTAKHGISGFTKTVAFKTAQNGATVNAVCPGYALTSLVEKQVPETAEDRASGSHLPQRRQDRVHDFRGHLELGAAVLDVVALGDPAPI